MSCYGWERGSVKLPVKEWKAARDRIFNAYNEKLAQCFEIANEIYNSVKTEKKGKRNFDVSSRVNTLAYEKLKQRSTSRDHYRTEFHFAHEIMDALVKDKKLVKPKKADFKPALASKGETLHDSDLSISFDNKTKTIEYRTDDNNHSKDAARESDLGKAFFWAMGRVNWTTKTGGYLREFDEYMSDEGHGARVSETWGKYAKPKALRQLHGHMFA